MFQLEPGGGLISKPTEVSLKTVLDHWIQQHHSRLALPVTRPWVGAECWPRHWVKTWHGADTKYILSVTNDRSDCRRMWRGCIFIRSSSTTTTSSNILITRCHCR